MDLRQDDDKRSPDAIFVQPIRSRSQRVERVEQHVPSLHQVPEDVRRRWKPPRYFLKAHEDTNRIILEVQASLNWPDELTEDLAKRVAEKQRYDDIVREMKENTE